MHAQQQRKGSLLGIREVHDTSGMLNWLPYIVFCIVTQCIINAVISHFRTNFEKAVSYADLLQVIVAFSILQSMKLNQCN